MSSRTLQEMDCLQICALLGMVFDEKSIKKQACKFKLFDKSESDHVLAYYQLHTICHNADNKNTIVLFKRLTVKYAAFVNQVKEWDCADFDSLAKIIEKSSNEIKAGYLFALLTDERKEMRNYGNYLSYHVVFLAIQKYKGKNGKNNKNKNDDFESKYNLLKSKYSSIKTESQKLKRDLKESNKEIRSLTISCEQSKSEVEKYKKHPDELKQMRRKIRKLEYMLEKQRHNYDVGSSEEYVENEVVESLFYKNRLQFKETVSHELYCENDCDDCILKDKKIVVIGGLGRLEVKYREVINNLGGECVFHNGSINKIQLLKNAIESANYVVFITAINSHGAMWVAKDACKKQGKHFCVMRGTSPGALKKRVIEAVRMAS